ncbi:MAG TPA: cytidylate kinase-like family protein [Bacteroidales bacterium]|nr:cytidylate kinase-like family protein [Bacteroidales bacterium]
MAQKSDLIITISRETGSGGENIGQQIARAFDMYYVDHEIIAMAAEKLSAVIDEVASQDEKIESFWKTFWEYSGTAPDAYIPYPKKFPPTSFDVFNAEAEIIKHIARERPSVIIGRCGFHVLRDHPGIVKIFIHADAKFRSERIQKLFSISEAEALKLINRSDKERTQYIKTFTGKRWTDATQYDICIDTGKMGIDLSAGLLIDFVKKYRSL